MELGTNESVIIASTTGCRPSTISNWIRSTHTHTHTHTRRSRVSERTVEVIDELGGCGGIAPFACRRG
jgi:hypothetical protein